MFERMLPGQGILPWYALNITHWRLGDSHICTAKCWSELSWVSKPQLDKVSRYSSQCAGESSYMFLTDNRMERIAITLHQRAQSRHSKSLSWILTLLFSCRSSVLLLYRDSPAQGWPSGERFLKKHAAFDHHGTVDFFFECHDEPRSEILVLGSKWRSWFELNYSFELNYPIDDG